MRDHRHPLTRSVFPGELLPWRAHLPLHLHHPHPILDRNPLHPPRISALLALPGCPHRARARYGGDLRPIMCTSLLFNFVSLPLCPQNGPNLARTYTPVSHSILCVPAPRPFCKLSQIDLLTDTSSGVYSCRMTLSSSSTSTYRAVIRSTPSPSMPSPHSAIHFIHSHYLHS